MTLIEQLNAVIIAIAEDISNNSDISVLLPRKIGATQRWYQKGLRYGAEYPYPYTGGTVTASNGWQYFVPFTALEDATITALEVFCETAQSGASVSLGIYASDVNNNISNPLFRSNPIGCSEGGVKNATCNVQITKGNVYWLSSMVIGSPAFYSNYSDSLKPIKGNTQAFQPPIIGYYTFNNSSMAPPYPTSIFDLTTKVPRVMFITG